MYPIVSVVQFYGRVVYCTFMHGFHHLFVESNFEKMVSNILMDLAVTDVLFTKVLQALSYNYQFIDETMHNKITSFTDNVPYSVDDVDEDAIRRLTRVHGLVFHDKVPRKAGMISLIYLIGNPVSGEKYILKLKRKHITRQLEECVYNMRVLVSVVSFMTSMWFNVDIVNTMDRHILMLEEQLDFKMEVENTKSIATNYENIDYVKVPKICDKYCNDNYIVMEYIEGRHFCDLAVDEYVHYCGLVAKMGITGVFVHGEIHGDLHAGNILFICNEGDDTYDVPTYQIALIDFGLTIKICTVLKSTIVYAGLNYRKKEEVPGIVKKGLNAVLDPPNIIACLDATSRDNILRDLEDILYNLSSDAAKLSQADFYKSFQVLNDNLSSTFSETHDIKLTDEFVKLQVATSMANGLTMQLCSGDYIKQMNIAINDLFHLDLLEDSD